MVLISIETLMKEMWFSYSAVIIAATLRPVRSGVGISAGPRDFYFLHKHPCPSHQTSYSVDTAALLSQPRREANHSLPSSAQVKNEWSCISTSLIRLHGGDWENCTFLPLQFCLQLFVH
jgi:hypothetical protein